VEAAPGPLPLLPAFTSHVLCTPLTRPNQETTLLPLALATTGPAWMDEVAECLQDIPLPVLQALMVQLYHPLQQLGTDYAKASVTHVWDLV
jgi:hypothetical protein